MTYYDRLYVISHLYINEKLYNCGLVAVDTKSELI